MAFLEVIESIFVIFLLAAWIWVIVGVIGDVFRSSDLGGFAKGLWVLFIIVVPWLGVLTYLIIRGRGMEQRSAQAVSAAQEAQRDYIKSVAGTSTADEISKLHELKNKGAISDAEFEAQKAKLLG